MARDSSPPVSRPSKFVLLVGISDALLEQCVVAASPYPVMRAESAAAALLKLGALRPALVIGGPDATPEDLALVRENALAVGATVLEATSETVPSLGERLRAAIADVESHE